MFLLMANQYGAARFRRGRIRIALLEENGRGATVKRGNLARTEKVPGADGLLEDQIERDERCGATGYGVGKLLETDALTTLIGVGELFLRRRPLARVGYPVRERGLLRGEQQQRQQSEKEASQFHILWVQRKAV
jgi:hypothetical protein